MVNSGGEYAPEQVSQTAGPLIITRQLTAPLSSGPTCILCSVVYKGKVRASISVVLSRRGVCLDPLRQTWASHKCTVARRATGTGWTDMRSWDLNESRNFILNGDLVGRVRLARGESDDHVLYHDLMCRTRPNWLLRRELECGVSDC